MEARLMELTDWRELSDRGPDLVPCPDDLLREPKVHELVADLLTGGASVVTLPEISKVLSAGGHRRTPGRSAEQR
jgi:hypothetical protein